MRVHSSWMIAAALVCAVQQSAVARAQQDDRLDVPYYAVKLMLGFAGEADIAGGEDDLEVSYGGGLQYMHPLHRHFALGGQLAFQSWQTEGFDAVDFDRNLYADLAVVPQGKLPLSRDVELYVSLPLGLSMDFVGEDDVVINGIAGFEIDAAVGFTLSLLLGARFALSDDFGLLAELGYMIHGYEHEATASVAGASVSADFDVDLSQIALNLGLYF